MLVSIQNDLTVFPEITGFQIKIPFEQLSFDGCRITVRAQQGGEFPLPLQTEFYTRFLYIRQ